MILRYFLVAKVWINLAHKFLTSKYSALIFKKILIYKPEFRKCDIFQKREKVLHW